MSKLPIEINLDLTDPNNSYLRSVFNRLKSKKYLPLSKVIISGVMDIKKPPNWNWNFKVNYIDLFYKSKERETVNEKKEK